MLHYIRGRITRLTPHQVVVEVGGIGLALRVALSVSRDLTLHQEVTLLTVLLLPREEGEPMLYGFLTEEERRLFLLLRKVPRVGPQKALALLSHFAADQLVQLIHTGNAAAIATVKGIGKKLAQQILIDLQSALRDFSPSSASPGYQDAYEALLALGFAPAEAHTRLQAAQKVAPEGSAEALLQLALRNP